MHVFLGVCHKPNQSDAGVMHYLVGVKTFGALFGKIRDFSSSAEKN